MFSWNAYPFLRYALILILGIWLSPYLPGIDQLKWTFIVLIILFVILNSIDYSRLVLGVLGGILISFLGAIHAYLHDPTTQKDHIIHVNYSKISHVSGSILSQATETPKYKKYVASLDHIIVDDSVHNVEGKVLLYVGKSEIEELSFLSKFYLKGTPQVIRSPPHSASFDYGLFMQLEGIYGQIFVEPKNISFQCDSSFFHPMSMAIRMRSWISKLLNKNIKGQLERDVLVALTIGDKSEMDEEISSNYAAAGVLHVLAVSGLHVGIIFLVLIKLFAPLKRVRAGPFIAGAAIILGIWFYAMITGLTPSVMRASTMFTIVAIQQSVDRKSNIYNSLGLSAFILLLINPNLIYSVGFQLSYLAVFGIVYLFPRIHQLVYFRIRPIQKIWSLICVSLAAQIATVPLSLYYFHQFPTYFILANLVVIPVISLVMVLVFPSIILGAFLPGIANGAFLVIEWVVGFMNEFIFWIKSLPVSIIEGIPMDSFSLWTIYGFLFFAFAGWQYKSFIASSLACLSLVAFNMHLLHKSNIIGNQSKIVIHRIDGGLGMDVIRGRNVNFVAANNPSTKEVQFQINPLRIAMNLPLFDSNNFPESNFKTKSVGPLKLMVHEDQRIVWVNGNLDDYDFSSLVPCDLLILNDAGSLTASDIVRTFDCEFVVINVSVKNALKTQLESKGILFHNVWEDGIWIVDLKSKKKPWDL